MNKHLLRSLLFLSKDDHAGGAAAPQDTPPAGESVVPPAGEPAGEPSHQEEAPRTLKAATAKLDEIRASHAELTGRVAQLTGERDQIKGQFEAAVTEATGFKNELATVRGELEAEKLARTEASEKAARAEENVTRLEQLCAIRGVDPKAAVSAGAGEPSAAAGLDPYAAYLAAVEAGDKKEAQRIYAEHKSAIFAARAGRK
jgi:hypothetical protein